LLECIAKDPQAFILKQGCGWRGLAAGRMPMDAESWMPREAGWTRLGLNFRDPLTCAPGGSAPPLEELRSLYEHLQLRILEMIEPSSLVLRRAKDAGRGAGERGLRGVPGGLVFRGFDLAEADEGERHKTCRHKTQDWRAGAKRGRLTIIDFGF
jgi:hypothetical protein